MESNNEKNDMDETSMKNTKKLMRSESNKTIEGFQEQNNYQEKDTIKNFEKLLITEQEFIKSQKNFIGSTEIKTGNR